jgi:DHA1 family multidrug resistance protein-like MFS transporter
MASAATNQTQPRPQRNLYVQMGRSMLYGLRENMVRTIWQPFALSLGASMPLLGLLESLGGFWGIVPTLMQPLGGWISDRRGRKPLVLLGTTFSTLGLSVLVLAGWTHNWLWLLPGIALLGGLAIAFPALDSLTAESAVPEARGRAFSLTNTFYALAGVVAPTLGGLLAQRSGFLSVLIAGTALEALTLVALTALLRETIKPQDRRKLDVAESLDMVRTLLTPPDRLRGFYIAITVDAIAYGTGYSLLFGLLSRSYGFTPVQLGLMSSACSLTWAASQWTFGKQVDKRGTVPFMIFSELLAVVIMIAWLFVRSFPAFLVLHALWGINLAAWMPAFLAWVTNSVTDKERAQEMGRLAAFRGLIAFPAPYVGGLLYNAFGFRGPILFNIVGALIVIFILWRWVGEPHRPLAS